MMFWLGVLRQWQDLQLMTSPQHTLCSSLDGFPPPTIKILSLLTAFVVLSTVEVEILARPRPAVAYHVKVVLVPKPLGVQQAVDLCK